MTIAFSQVNIWAVLVSAVATFMVGGVWYGLLFAKQWVAVHGFSEEVLQQMKKNEMRCFGVFFIGDLVLATVVSFLVVNLGIDSAIQGAMLGFFLWLGIAATIGAAKNAASCKPMAAYLIDTCHELVSLVVMGSIIGAWR